MDNLHSLPGMGFRFDEPISFIKYSMTMAGLTCSASNLFLKYEATALSPVFCSSFVEASIRAANNSRPITLIPFISNDGVADTRIVEQVSE